MKNWARQYKRMEVPDQKESPYDLCSIHQWLGGGLVFTSAVFKSAEISQD